MSSLPPSSDTSSPVEKQALSQLHTLRKEMTDTMSDLSNIADKGASTLLLTLGATLLIFSFLFKLKPFGVQIAEMAPAEFVSAILVSMILLLAGAGIRVLQFWWQEQAGKLVREAGVTLLAKGIDASTKLASQNQDSNRNI
ncbi:MAG: hypothetical protein ACXW01_05150 [Methylobacter sp.]